MAPDPAEQTKPKETPPAQETSSCDVVSGMETELGLSGNLPALEESVAEELTTPEHVHYALGDADTPIDTSGTAIAPAKTAEIQGKWADYMVGSVDATPFTERMPEDSEVEAAKILLVLFEKEKLDKDTKTWAASILTILPLMISTNLLPASDREAAWNKTVQGFSNKDYIFGAEGVYNILLALRRIIKVQPNLKDLIGKDKGKIADILGTIKKISLKRGTHIKEIKERYSYTAVSSECPRQEKITVHPEESPTPVTTGEIKIAPDATIDTVDQLEPKKPIESFALEYAPEDATFLIITIPDNPEITPEEFQRTYKGKISYLKPDPENPGKLLGQYIYQEEQARWIEPTTTYQSIVDDYKEDYRYYEIVKDEGGKPTLIRRSKDTIGLSKPALTPQPEDTALPYVETPGILAEIKTEPNFKEADLDTPETFDKILKKLSGKYGITIDRDPEKERYNFKTLTDRLVQLEAALKILKTHNPETLQILKSGEIKIVLHPNKTKEKYTYKYPHLTVDLDKNPQEIAQTIKDKIPEVQTREMLKTISKENGIPEIILWDGVEYHWNKLLPNLAKIDRAVKIVRIDKTARKKLQLGESLVISTPPYIPGIQKGQSGRIYIGIDPIAQTEDEIVQTIVEAEAKLPALEPPPAEEPPTVETPPGPTDIPLTTSSAMPQILGEIKTEKGFEEKDLDKPEAFEEIRRKLTERYGITITLRGKPEEDYNFKELIAKIPKLETAIQKIQETNPGVLYEIKTYNLGLVLSPNKKETSSEARYPFIEVNLNSTIREIVEKIDTKAFEFSPRAVAIKKLEEISDREGIKGVLLYYNMEYDWEAFRTNLPKLENAIKKIKKHDTETFLKLQNYRIAIDERRELSGTARKTLEGQTIISIDYSKTEDEIIADIVKAAKEIKETEETK